MRLGIDVGSVRVGVAACDRDGILAYPVTTLPRNQNESGDDTADLAEIGRLARELAVIEVVVGLPRSLDGGEGPAAAGARGYAQSIARVCAPVPVRLVDERLTTVDAHRGLRESGVSGRGQRRVVDQAAAVLILQSAIDAERATGFPPGHPAATTRRRPRRKG
ncbi:MAG: Holliday junction resolvase RuvX [Dermatophilaceae bacterium]|uniref:Holliday junction resolvase RuvX n=1 Tax=Nostocoides sp. TaxID=1917966 RepID=UPI002D1FA8D1|nr:Holliday junction resolvase RuvX [Tetrasphaera sp.]